ncbi:hypothetical protein MO973_19515 [Paenibacillus sp. TRM 82003]|nr:hypothetical protein [Paenibacillus sp. TRM 82003]
MNKGMDIKELASRIEDIKDIAFANEYVITFGEAEFLLSTIRSLEAERDKYKEALDDLGYDDGFIICPNCGRVKADG